MSKKRDNKKKEKRLLVTRKGIALVIILALMILIVNIVTASYSWFMPLAENHNGMGYQSDTNLRSENCSFVTYAGTKQSNDSIDYNETVPITSSSYSINANTPYYFKTKIVNADTKFSSNVSLFFESMPADTTLAVTFPSNTVRATGSSPETDFYVIRNAYVKVYVSTDADGPGLLEVEWFVKSTANTSLDFTKMYLMYN